MHPFSGSRPLRIVQIGTVEVGGGAAKVARKLHERFLERGHDSLLVVGQKSSDDPRVIAIDNSGARRGVGGLLAGRLELFGLQDVYYPGSRRISELLGGSWDVTHVHNLHGGYFELSALGDLSRRAPLILTMHDMWLLTGHCAYSCGCERWRTGCGSCPDLTLYPAVRRDATRANLRRKRRHVGELDVVVTSPSRWALDLARDSYLGAKPTRLVPNPVDTRVFTPGDQRAARASLGLPQERPIVLLPARLAFQNEYKAAWMLEAAVDGLRDLGVLAVAYGQKDEEAHDGLRILAESFDESRIAQAFRAADVVVYPSRAETSPLAILEAFASARPVVATRVGGVPELVEEGRNGLLLEPGDAEAFAVAVRRLLNDPALARAMGRAGLVDVRERHDLDRVADAWLAWYEELGAAFRARADRTPRATSGTGAAGARSRQTETG